MFPLGGLNPVSVLRVPIANGPDDLVVANNGDGRLTLLEDSPEGLILVGFADPPGLPRPTSLALASLIGDELGVYATTEGEASAFLVMFFLGNPAGPGPLTSPGGSSSPARRPPARRGWSASTACSPCCPSGNPRCRWSPHC